MSKFIEKICTQCTKIISLTHDQETILLIDGKEHTYHWPCADTLFTSSLTHYIKAAGQQFKDCVPKKNIQKIQWCKSIVDRHIGCL